MNEVEKITNFEKIKAMNIDEMAEFLKSERCMDACFGMDWNQCKEMLKQWLESEVREWI